MSKNLEGHWNTNQFEHFLKPLLLETISQIPSRQKIKII